MARTEQARLDAALVRLGAVVALPARAWRLRQLEHAQPAPPAWRAVRQA